MTLIAVEIGLIDEREGDCDCSVALNTTSYFQWGDTSLSSHSNSTFVLFVSVKVTEMLVGNSECVRFAENSRSTPLLLFRSDAKKQLSGL